jgi:hypothetical protein
VYSRGKGKHAQKHQNGWLARILDSLITPRIKHSVLAVLEATMVQLETFDFSELSDRQLALAFDLLEHEVQHHGQLIRYVYGNSLSFPESWHTRYTV